MTTPNGPGRPRDPAVDAAILRAAVELLIERGVPGAGIEQIAQRAGVAKVSVYRRWKSKSALLAHAVESLREEIPDVESTGRPAGELPVTIDELLPRWGALLTDPRYRLLTARLVGAGPEHPELLAAYREHHVLPRRRRSTAMLAGAVAAGLLPEDTDVEMLVDMISGAVIQYLLMEPTEPDAAEIEDYLRRLLTQAGLYRRP
ncbi:TetR family transcriptional regulator [Stackebrandtia albiflava]|uniref:TetR family transcriptional regulator n=1 Tax=Stackebrandtia albiflava TaxID=406432 RepID=A0A562V2R5_9ACTN|nr:TetR/AcrR family transcriptional regulator [Stackebrandtia albiflava]TWJ12186.1 TetR family transcriptional regulator [Stackebrandtia albiflava]